MDKILPEVFLKNEIYDIVFNPWITKIENGLLNVNNQ